MLESFKIAPAQIISKTRDKKKLTAHEIRSFVHGLVSGEVTDYQMSAWLMAVYLNSITPDETVALTQAMLESGDRWDLSSIRGPKVDKHSTGGVGDKVSIILAPLAAACGLFVPMMSGRGLGHSGGTLDKLESIPGFTVQLPKTRALEILKSLGCVMIGQSQDIAPADKKMYALRDVTGTVECIPLIVASILSKKLAEGTDSLVLDVKTGNGAFMKTPLQAANLANALTSVAKKLGLKCKALITDMNQPLGYAVGNSLEMIECIEILRGKKESHPATYSSEDLIELTLALVAQMLVLSKISPTLIAGKKLARKKLEDGSAWKIFLNLIREQGGKLPDLESSLPISSNTQVWMAPKSGFLNEINTEAVGLLLIEMGGGRKRAEDPIDPRVGFVFHHKLGSKISKGTPLITAYLPANTSPEKRVELKNLFMKTLKIGSTRKKPPRLIHKSIG